MVTVKELREEASKHKIKGRSTMTKVELCAELKRKGIEFNNCTKGARKKKSPVKKSPVKKNQIRYIEYSVPRYLQYEDGTLSEMKTKQDQFIHPNEIYKSINNQYKLSRLERDLTVGSKGFDAFLATNPVVYIKPQTLKGLKKFKYNFVKLGRERVEYDILGKMLTTKNNVKPKVGEIWEATELVNLDNGVLNPYNNYPHKIGSKIYTVDNFVRITKVMENYVVGEILKVNYIDFDFANKNGRGILTNLYFEPYYPITPKGKKTYNFKPRRGGYSGAGLMLMSPYDEKERVFEK